MVDAPRSIRGSLAMAAPPTTRVLFWPDLDAMPRPPQLVKRLLDTSGLALLVGPPGCGKSFLACDFGLHVALGWPWQNRKVRQGGVLYMSAEGGTGVVPRLRAFAQHHRLDLTDAPFGVVLEPTNLLDQRGVDQLLADTRAIDDLALVIIDTAARTMPGGKEDAEDIGAFVAACDRIRAETSAAVLVVHHVGKDASRGARGSSVLPAACDTVIEVTRDASTKVATAEVTKQRDGETGAALAFSLEVAELGADEDGEPVTSCIVVAADGAPTGRVLAPVSGQARIALDQLRRAIEDAGEPLPASNHSPAGKRGVRVDLWRRYCYAAFASAETADAKSKAFRRAMDTLQGRAVIGAWGEWAWCT